MYTTVQRVLDENKSTDTPQAMVLDATTVRKVLTAIRKVTRRLEVIGWDFEPRYGTEIFTANPQNVNSWYGELILVNRKGQRHLLASAADMPTIVSNSQTLSFDLTTVSGPQVLPDPQGYTPIRILRLNDANNAISTGWYPTQLPLIDSISITGWWGYARDYANRWADSLDDVQDNPLSATATTVTVTDLANFDSRLNTPRFSPGNLIRFDNELAEVLTTNVATESLGLQRGAHGTAAASHSKGTSIFTWYPESDVQDTVSRQAAYFYARRGAYEAQNISGIGVTTYPPDMVAELYAMLEGYQNE